MRFCTLFDSQYAIKGLALYESLMDYAPYSKLTILAMDNAAYEMVKNLRNVEAWCLFELESIDHRIRAAHQNRTWQEMCWTMASVLLDRCVNAHGQCVYLDADSCFFSDPSSVYEKYSEYPVALALHRFAKKDMARLSENGKYNVCWVQSSSHRFTMEWSGETLRWCYNKNENGLFGDQASLNWLGPKYNAVDITEIGVDCAPWNQAQYRFSRKDGQTFVNDEPLVLYHCHELLNDDKGNITRYTNWALGENVFETVYAPYQELLKRVHAKYIKG